MYDGGIKLHALMCGIGGFASLNHVSSKRLRATLAEVGRVLLVAEGLHLPHPQLGGLGLGDSLGHFSAGVMEGSRHQKPPTSRVRQSPGCHQT
jgi:hypothetical protein